MNASPSISFGDVGECRFLHAAGNESLWQEALLRAPVQPVGYHRCHIDYQHAYFSQVFSEYFRLDQLIFHGDRLIALWPLAAYKREDEWVISSHINGSPGIAPPLHVSSLTEKPAKHLLEAWATALAALANRLGQCPSIRVNTQAPSIQITDWQRRLLLLGAGSRLRHRMVVDLTLPPEETHRQLRKSYKALINQAKRLWAVSIDDIGDAPAFSAFQALHETVAGRKTRHQTTWDEQFASIQAKAAFAVYLYEPDGQLIGASLYNLSRDEAYYAVGAYDRKLFDRPVAHLSLDSAIGHARNLGCRQFILGDRPFPGDLIPPNEKEAKIAFFKEGFATSLQFLPDFVLSTAALPIPSLQGTSA